MEAPPQTQQRDVFVPDKPLLLSDLREQLIRQEETIIFALIERAQFKRNSVIYQPGGLEVPSTSQCDNFLNFFLRETEKVHSLMRRYTAPDEHAFHPETLLKPVLSLLDYPKVIKPNTINFNNKLMSMYINSILPLICAEGDDGQYGSSSTCDISALQAMSKRVHYGKFVAEAKFQEDPVEYTRLIREKNSDALMKLLTNEKVEQQVLRRVRAKSLTYGRDIEGGEQEGAPKYKVNADHIVAIYRDYLIPLTKEIEVDYLLQRVGHMCIAYLGPAGSYSHQAALQYFRGDTSNIEYLPFPNFGQVFQAVLSNQANYAVVPIENSTTGRVHQAISHFFDAKNAKVCGDTYLKVEHCLLCKKDDLNTDGADRGSRQLNIKVVYSHPQALQQCDKFLKINYPEAESVSVGSTSQAAALVSESTALPGGGICAAIASSLCVDQYPNLTVAKHNVQDESNNTTRFVVLCKDNVGPTGNDRTMLLFGVRHISGALAKVLSVLQAHNINLCCLESYPNPSEAWGYSFFVELEGHLQDASLKAAIAELQEGQLTTFLQILGAFPAAIPPTPTRAAL